MRKAAVVTLAMAAACSSSSPAPTAPCTATLGEGAALDLVVHGAGRCATTLGLALRVATGDPAAPTWSAAASAPLKIGGAWSQRPDGAFARDVTITNASSSPVTLVGLEWSTAGGVGLDVDRMLHDGYQSWTYTGIEAIPPSLADTLGTAPHGGDDENPLGEVSGVSWWWSSVSDASGTGVVVGADGGTVLKTYVAADGAAKATRVRVVQGVTGDAIVLAPGASKTLDGLYLALGDVRAGLDAYAAYVASRHPPATPRKPPAGGWGSWNMYYANIAASDLRAEAAWAKANLAPLGLTDFLLDDGYEPHWGVWSASTAFGADLATLTAEQSAAGLAPALWLAPFYVLATDPLVAMHPDWFVHQAGGSLRTYNNIGPDYAALDASSADARAYVVTAMQQLRSWGFRTLKIDFLFGGATAGVRQAPLTSLESYALWMKTIREAVPDVRIVGCGAPMLPSVGWVDAMRIGPDIAYDTSPAPRWAFLAAEARYIAMRATTDAWWALDPDVLLLRGDGIDDAEAWTTIVATALAGGSYLLGDGRQTSAPRLALALAPDLLAATRDGVAARPLDLVAETDGKLVPSPLFAGNAETSVPHVWKKTAGGRGWQAVFAWGVDGFATDVSLPASAVELVPSGGAITRRPAGGDQHVAVPLHGTRLFAW